MPSLASYRRRKAEVVHLVDEVDRLSKDIHYMERYVEDLERALKNTNLLRHQVEVMLRVWQQYVVDHYMVELPKPILIVKKEDVPSCIKPKDVGAYIFRNESEEAMKNGPSDFPQELS